MHPFIILVWPLVTMLPVVTASYLYMMMMRWIIVNEEGQSVVIRLTVHFL